MVTPHEAAIWFLPFVLPVAVWVAYTDLKTMKIPNMSFVMLVGIFLVVGPFVLPSLGEWGWRWLHLVVVLIITFILNQVGQMGAGDAKYMSAMAPFIALQDAGSFMIILAVMALVATTLKLIIGAIPALKPHLANWKSFDHWRVFPYGLALSMSFVLYLVLCLDF